MHQRKKVQAQLTKHAAQQLCISHSLCNSTQEWKLHDYRFYTYKCKFTIYEGRVLLTFEPVPVPTVPFSGRKLFLLCTLNLDDWTTMRNWWNIRTVLDNVKNITIKRAIITSRRGQQDASVVSSQPFSVPNYFLFYLKGFLLLCPVLLHNVFVLCCYPHLFHLCLLP